ncbi:MAG: DNA methyltransferase [Tepidisphaeraceae bacterium]
MAAIEDLIRQIADTRLRDQLATEVAKLKEKKTFGLVFEDHLPELLRLPNVAATVGARIVRTDDPNHVPYRVTSEVNGKKIKAAPESGGPEETLERSAVVVARAFGEPMYPALIPVDTIERAPGKPWHVLINADNYHALQLLLYGYENKVDVIYIDPPYNTGARDWKYNNDYVDRTDTSRHSKWLSMMSKRLELAKRMLKPDGVLICTIDENEVGHLSVLLEEHFPAYLRHMVSVVINPKGTGKYNFARVDEYAFFCVPDTRSSIVHGVPGADAKTMGAGEGALFFPKGVETSLFVPDAAESDAAEEDEDDEAENDEEDEDIEEEMEASDLPFPEEELPEWELRHARRRGAESSYRHQRAGQFYPIFIDEKARRVVRAGEAIPLDAKPSFAKVDGLTPIWPIDKEKNDRCWRFHPPTMQPLIEAGKVKLGKYNEKFKSWTLNIWERKPESKKLKTVWWKRSHDAGTHGTTLLHKLLGRRSAFPFPKSIYSVADALAAVVRTRPDAIIFDFFAGSGTTLQATCMLNAQFGGNRRCILATNNEVGEKLAKKLLLRGIQPGTAEYEKHGIAETVTWPRTQAVLTGKRRDGRKVPGAYLSGRQMCDGFDENAAYFKLAFLDPAEVNRGDKFEAIIPILWMLAGCRGAPEVSRGSGKWFIPKQSPFAVLLKEDEFAGFAKAVAKREDIEVVFLVTDSADHFHRMSTKLGKGYRCIQLYRSYIDTFRINLTEPGTISASGTPVQPTPATTKAVASEGGK